MTTSKKSTIELSEPSVVMDGEGVPTSIRIFKKGDNLDDDGENAIYEPKTARSLMKSNTRSDSSVPIGVGHGMIAGRSAPVEAHESHGWGTLRADDSGVWLDNIKWTLEMRDKLKQRKFRFVSPTFVFNTKTRNILSIVEVSLTNIPATADAEPITRSRSEKTKSEIINRKANMSETEKELETTVAQVERAADETGDKGSDAAAGRGPEDPSAKEMNLSDVDIDVMSVEEVKAFAVKLIDECMDLRAKISKSSDEGKDADKEEGGEDDDEDDKDKEAKRDIVDALFGARLVRFNDIKSLKAMKLRDLVKHEKQLRSNKFVARAKTAAADKAESAERPHSNSIAEKLSEGPPVELGARDKDVEAYMAQFGHSYEKLGLSRNADKVFGTHITSMARSYGSGKKGN